MGIDIVTQPRIRVALDRECSPAGHLTAHDKRLVRELVRRTDPNSGAVGTSPRGKRVGWVSADRNPEDGYGVWLIGVDGYITQTHVTVG